MSLDRYDVNGKFSLVKFWNSYIRDTVSSTKDQNKKVTEIKALKAKTRKWSLECEARARDMQLQEFNGESEAA